MKKVLIIGGAGTFGARIAELLSESDQYLVLLAGRDLVKAEKVKARLGRGNLACQPIDRLGDVEAQLRQIAPWLVIDAAGPFQQEVGDRYAVPRACMACGAHYIDLADGRAFVADIVSLDSDAKAAGIAVISGASSVPALSMSVVAELAKKLPTFAAIDLALSASNRATAGPSVNTAILSYVGQPIRLLEAGTWRLRHGWQALARKSFSVAGRAPIKGRLVGLCEVPDLDLLPKRYPGLRSEIFRAGAELAVQNLVLWLLSFTVRWRWLQSLKNWAPLFHRLQGLAKNLRTDRSAMSVSLTGQDAGDRRSVATWTLLAEDGHGPWVPSFAATLLTEKLARGAISPGACPASDLLTLDDFAPLFAKFHLFTEMRIEDLPPSPHAQVLGANMERLPQAVRALHTWTSATRVDGRGSVQPGNSFLARTIRRLLALPPEMTDMPVSVTFEIGAGCEIWRRDFGGYRFKSQVEARSVQGTPVLCETFWPLSFDFDLTADPDGLGMHLRGWRLFGIGLPRSWAPRISAKEGVRDGRFTFDVAIHFPWGSPLVSYHGWLELPACHPHAHILNSCTVNSKY